MPKESKRANSREKESAIMLEEPQNLKIDITFDDNSEFKQGIEYTYDATNGFFEKVNQKTH